MVNIFLREGGKKRRKKGRKEEKYRRKISGEGDGITKTGRLRAD